MDAFSDPRVTELVGVWASQVGKTDCLLNMIGQRIARQPGPMLLIQPTLGMAEAWSKDRLAPMLRDTPCLRGRVKDARSRDSGNTVLHKQFLAGHLTMAGANSPASLASRPIREVFFDEVDRYETSAGTEGDPVQLAATRTRAFWNAKKVYISSPGTRGASRIEIVWNRSDQRFYYVACPDCETRQTLKWSQVQWEKDPESGEHLPETAVYACEHCGSAWTDVQRWSAVKGGQWKATRPFKGCAGFHVNALAAPWESCRLEELVKQWLEAQGNPELLKVFANTVLAEWWEDQYESIDDAGLMKRREPMERADGRCIVPAQAALITAGVDVQEARIEVTVDAWGTGEECWRLAHDVLFGDPSSPSLWEDLDRYLLRPWVRAAGGVDWIRAAAVDTGGLHTQASYDFCGPRFRRMTPDGGRSFVFAIKGMAGAGEVWPRQASKATTKVPLWPIRVDVAKEQIYGRLTVNEPGPGYVHFHDELDRAYFTGLTAEKIVTRMDKKGFPRRTWEKRRSGMRNEPLDCAAYSYAALCGLRAMGFDLEHEVLRLPQRPAVQALGQPERAQGTAVPQKAAPRLNEEKPGWLGNTGGWL